MLPMNDYRLTVKDHRETSSWAKFQAYIIQHVVVIHPHLSECTVPL